MEAKIFKISTPETRSLFQMFIPDPITDDIKYVCASEDGYELLTEDEFPLDALSALMSSKFLMLSYIPIEIEK